MDEFSTASAATTITCTACTIEFPILTFILDKHFDKMENQFRESDHEDKLIEIRHISGPSSASRKVSSLE